MQQKHHPFFLTSKYFLDLNVEMDKNQNTIPKHFIENKFFKMYTLFV